MQILENLLHFINVPQGIKVFKRSFTLILYFKCFSNTGRNLHTLRNPTQLSNCTHTIYILIMDLSENDKHILIYFPLLSPPDIVSDRK